MLDWDDHDRVRLSDLSDMTVWHETAFREHTSIHNQYRERKDVMFEGRVIRTVREIDGAGVSLEDWNEQAEGLGWVGWAVLVGWWSERGRWLAWAFICNHGNCFDVQGGARRLKPTSRPKMKETDEPPLGLVTVCLKWDWNMLVGCHGPWHWFESGSSHSCWGCVREYISGWRPGESNWTPHA